MVDLDTWLISAIIAKGLLYISTFAATGSMLFLIVLKPSQTSVKIALLRWCIIGALISLIVTGLRISIQAGQLLDDGIVGMMDRDMLALVGGAPLGQSSLLRALGIVFLMSGALWTSMRLVLGILGTAMIALSFAFVGHATTEITFLGALIFYHLIAVSYWFGALMPLYRLAGDQNTWREAGLLVERFGRQAAFIVPLLIAVGGVFAYSLLGSIQAIFTSTYGQVLLVKITVVSILLALAALNKLRFVPALNQGNPTGAKHLRTSIKWEALAFAGIFIITAILTSAVNLPEAHG